MLEETKYGNTAKAIEHYQKFLELWKDANPGIVEEGYVKERVTGYRGCNADLDRAVHPNSTYGV